MKRGAMKRTPDRFERTVNKITSRKIVSGYGSTGLIWPNQAITLLRRQHRAMVKMVKEAIRFDAFEERYPEHQYGIAMMEKGRYINREYLLYDINKYKR